MLVDLQIHSDALPHHSSWRPGTLIPALQVAGISVFAITDHNTTAGVPAMRAAAERVGLACISGCEIDTAHNGKLWHTLLYGIDPLHPDVVALCASVDARNAADAQRLIEELPAAGYTLPAFAHDPARHINVAEVATALARHNALPGRVDADDEAAGMRFLLQRPGAYNPPSVPEAVAVAHAAGGVAMIAHPGRSKGVYAIPADAADIAAFVAAGIDGLEVWYPAHTAQQTAFYLAQAQVHGLLVSGGSDSHHPDQPLARWDGEPMRALLDRLKVKG
ncbi:MAG: hypothetical protein RLZZ297_346 [Chloroflexota bacterium]